MSVNKKILVIITTGFDIWGGLTTVAMNYYRAMDKTGLQIDFASDNKISEQLFGEINQNNSRYIQLPNRKKHILKYMAALYKTIRIYKYDVVHIHGNSATMAFDLFPAYCGRVGKRIIQVHATRSEHKFLACVLKPFMNFWCTDRIAVSKEAGCYLYKNKKFMILCNAIDVGHYRFRQAERNACREKWEIPVSAYVVGTVGKMNSSKNQFFLLKIFSEVLKKLPNAVLLIVGDGELRAEMERQIEDLGLQESCILTGMQNDTAVFLAAMDFFCFPSKYEGFGMALLEAQASGLHAICSDVISKEVLATDLCVAVPLDRPKEWMEHICQFEIPVDREKTSKDAIRQIKMNGLEIKSQADRLREIYLR